MAIEIVIRGTANTSALKDAASDVREVGEAAGSSEGKMKGFFSLIGGGAVGGVLALGAGIGAVASAGLGFNNSMEQARAKINAFTKDGAATTEILEMVADRAAKTPFAFEEMAEAAAGLGPAAKSAGLPLEDLIGQAEVLAASNPSEGLVGATFALKEALSGDFTSAIERFNLSRSYINQLKAEGVPALEIVRQAMAQAGYDSGLVAEMANTLQGRWSTLSDTFTTLAGKVTQPIFDAVSAGVGQLNDYLTTMAPTMTAVADQLAAFVGSIIAGQGPAQGLLAALQPVVAFLQANWQPIVAAAVAIIGYGLAGAIATGVAALAAVIAAAAPVIAVLALVGVVAAALQGAWAANFGGIREATFAAMAAIQAVITAVLGVVQTFWAQNGAQIMTFAQTTWTTVQQIIGTVVAIIATVVSTVFGGIAAFISTHGAEIQLVLSTAWNIIQTTIETVLAVIQGVVNTVLAVMTGDWETAQQSIQGIVSALGTFLSEQFNNVKTLVVELGPDLLDAATGVGRAIVDGIAGGISAAAGAIADAAKNAAKSALDAAKSALGIKSPSTVFAQMVGLPIAQGMAMGIRQGVPMVASAAGGLAGAAVGGASTTVNVGGMTINQAPGQRGDQLARMTADQLRQMADMRR